MNYDGLILAALSAEFRSRIIGGKLQHVRQHSDTDFTLELRLAGRTERLLMSCDPRFPRIYLTASREPAVPEPSAFCMTLRKHLEGLFVTNIRQIGMDRVLHIEMTARLRAPRTLIVEIMGKHSNIVLVDEGQRVLAAAKYVGVSMSRTRQILPGGPYLPPPGDPKADWAMLDRAQIREICAQYAQTADAKGWLMKTFAGIGPFLANEVIARIGNTCDLSCEGLSGVLIDIAEVVHSGDIHPVLIRHDGRDVAAYPIPSLQYTKDEQHPRENLNDPVDAMFRSLLANNRIEDERRQVLVSLERSLSTKQQFLDSARRTIEEAERSERYKQIGDLILGSVQSITKGDVTAQLVNYFDPDLSTIEVELDEKLTPQENAQRYYKRYRKTKEALALASSRLELLESEVAELGHALSRAESLETVEELRALRDDFLARGLLRHEKQTVEQGPPDELQGKHIRRFTTPDGWEILYGENATANDLLTTRIARPNDLWFHTRSITGAHVVIRVAGRSVVVPRSVIEQAAGIAAKNSDAKHSSLVPVDYTLRKFVRKPRGSAPGRVTYTNEKTIDVRMQ